MTFTPKDGKSYTLREMSDRYGYQWLGMVPLTKAQARQLIALGATVYHLHEDDTESMYIQGESDEDFDGMWGIENEELRRVTFKIMGAR